MDDALKELMNTINQKLLKNKELHVEIHLGLLVDWKRVDTEFFNKKLKYHEKYNLFFDVFKTQIDKTFNQLGNFPFDENVTDRIDIYGIPNFHAKYSLMIESFNNFKPISGIMGSSNLTKGALWGKGRLELDLYMTGGEENELLCSFAKEVDQIREFNTGKKFASWSFKDKEFEVYESEEMKHYLEVVEETREIFGEARREWELEELVKNQYFLSSSEDREALLESDRDQEISYGD
ncbi:hypothetical protein [Photobacterium leiognathi]|uniref:hypothetical protein n=1 Tax=Photobacterium leiognathi TaxID=553611 RepID=UPI0027387FE5|nr:hypothetical protein [Photobacterium leiognathi]